MKIQSIHGKDYRLPGNLNSFQEDLYVHLINWKWRHITTEEGRFGAVAYDAILPDRYAHAEAMPHLHSSVLSHLAAHRKRNPFRIHPHFYHMASSQAANINLFLPVLHHAGVSDILGRIKPDFASLATDQLDHGYCLEFWGSNFRSDAADRGPLGDKSGSHGTDSDLAIAYRNHEGALCLWLIEHKLTEKEFTPCSGPRSKDRDHARHHCTNSFAEILRDKQACFHHDFNKRKYWSITERNRDLFVHHANHAQCPFQGGMNQLWRNLLLALALEQDNEQPYAHATFSVVKHAANPHLDESLDAFKALIANSSKFSVFNSDDLLQAAEAMQDGALSNWARWYRDLYML